MPRAMAPIGMPRALAFVDSGRGLRGLYCHGGSCEAEAEAQGCIIPEEFASITYYTY